MDISGWLLLIVLLLLAVVSGYFVYCIRFVYRLAKSLKHSRRTSQPLAFNSVPYPFRLHYSELQKLILSLIKVSHRDSLTGLPNRVGLKQALQNHHSLDKGTILLIDIHRFKHINDVFGFAFGDHLLKAVTERLMSWKEKKGLLEDDLLHQEQGKKAILARMEGDEFILCSHSSPIESEVLAFKAYLEQEYLVGDVQVFLKFQVGVLDLAKHSPFNIHLDKDVTPSQDKLSLLLKRSDLALIRAKSVNERLAWYRLGDDCLKLREHQLLSQLPKALREGQLYLEYQAKFDLRTCDYLQAESLVRWKHPELGVISPAEFIPLAESAGIIDLVSYWALDTVLCQQREWQRQGVEINTAVNLSSLDIVDPKLYHYVKDKLTEYDIAPKWLTIEVTESALMQDVEFAVASLSKLNKLGVKLAIDDFGTGHSSLAYLKYLPIHEVKIDKAFLEGLEQEGAAQSIVQTCISLASNLGFEVTVEGVEDTVTADLLIDMGVDTLQGQLYASPMTSHALAAWLSELRQKLK